MQTPDSLLPFVERLTLMYPDDWQTILSSFSSERDVSFRTNTLLSTDQEIETALHEAHIPYTKSTSLPGAYTSLRSYRKDLASLPLWKDGKVAIQSLSSQLVSLLLSPKADQLILDACASPGSKTSHMAALMRNTGNIVANDVSWARLGKLKDVIRQLGVTNVIPVNLPAEVLWRDYADTFDHAVCDVPCTMEGRIQLTDPESYGDWSVKKIKRLSIEQKGILRSVMRCVKPGGSVLYSTCTLAPEENEEVIDWILEKDPGITVEPLSIPHAPTSRPMMSWLGKTFAPSVRNCVRIVPNTEWEGFFVAKLRRQK